MKKIGTDRLFPLRVSQPQLETRGHRLAGLGLAAVPPCLRRLVPKAAGLAADRRGHVFLLAGLLLVMGTVTLGGVFVTMNASEDGASREQRQNIMDPVSRLLNGFNESVQGVVLLGETNITLFKERVDDLAERVHVQAAKDGIYMSLELDATPDPSVWQTPGRCLSYDSDRSASGAVIGHDVASKRETIVGALFDMHATDGRQVVHFPYYVKIHDCLPTSMKTWFTGLWVQNGFVLDPENAKSGDDNNAVMTVGELPQGSIRIFDNATINESSITYYGWENERYMSENDTSHSHHPATPLSDYIKFFMDMSGVPPDYPIENVKIRLDAWHEDVTDDYLQLRTLYNGTVTNTWAIPTQDDVEQTFRYDIGLAPSGAPYWTLEELALVAIEFQVIEVNKFDPPAFFMVEYVDLEFDYVAPEKYAFLATIDWPTIPEAYDTHHIELRYRFTESTPGEEFLVQVQSNGTWETRMTLSPTAGAWEIVQYQIQPWELEGGILEMRLVDSVDNDRWTGDGDQIEFDYLYLWSEIGEE